LGVEVCWLDFIGDDGHLTLGQQVYELHNKDPLAPLLDLLTRVLRADSSLKSPGVYLVQLHILLTLLLFYLKIFKIFFQATAAAGVLRHPLITAAGLTTINYRHVVKIVSQELPDLFDLQKERLLWSVQVLISDAIVKDDFLSHYVDS
jgi:hypothetical protein